MGDALASREAGSGARADFESIYRENVDSVFAFLCRRVGPQAAQDLVAETFCRAFGAYDRYEDRGLPVRAWLFRIAYNLMVGESRRKRFGTLSLDDVASGSERLLERRNRGDREEVERFEVDHHAELARALDALGCLAQRQRSVIELRFLQELTVSEAAVVLESNEDAVRALTYRALRALRTAYQRQPQARNADSARMPSAGESGGHS
jgi:RNA polymerase sigma-70 factor (ECF subfamily)